MLVKNKVMSCHFGSKSCLLKVLIDLSSLLSIFFHFKESTSMLALLDICERSLLSVEFHHCELFIKFAVNLASDVSRRKDGRSQLLPRGKSIVLRLLSNECDIVKEMAYQICLDIVTVSMICVTLGE